MTADRPAPGIEIVEPDPAWRDDFEAIGLDLRESFGDRALRIDHIGSTAVAALAAKPIIDVQVTVGDLEGAPDLLVAVGFAMTDIRHDDSPVGLSLEKSELEKHVATRRGAVNANVHVRVDGRFNQRYALLSRDYFRAHPAAALAYAELKRNLVRVVGDDVGAYYSVKGPVFDIVYAAAEEWALHTCWQPGPSDA